MNLASSSRRSFLTTSAALTAASASRVLGANDRLRLAVIGTGGRGQYLMKELNRQGGVEWVAVCDVYDVRRSQALKRLHLAVAGRGASDAAAVRSRPAADRLASAPGGIAGASEAAEALRRRKPCCGVDTGGGGVYI